MSNPKPINPRRGEVWDVILASDAGAEPQKPEPAVVISVDGLHISTPKLVIPITTWKDKFSGTFWIVAIKPYDTNGLEKYSAIDVMQIRGVAVKHFIRRRGELNAKLMDEIIEAIAAVIEYA